LLCITFKEHKRYTLKAYRALRGLSINILMDLLIGIINGSIKPKALSL